MLKTDRWKLIEYRVDGESRTELFDLQTDPAELHDIAADTENQSRLQSLRERLVAWQQSNGDRWMPLDLTQ